MRRLKREQKTARSGMMRSLFSRDIGIPLEMTCSNGVALPNSDV
jgi:hypothetical protein